CCVVGEEAAPPGYRFFLGRWATPGGTRHIVPLNGILCCKIINCFKIPGSGKDYALGIRFHPWQTLGTCMAQPSSSAAAIDHDRSHQLAEPASLSGVKVMVIDDSNTI